LAYTLLQPQGFSFLSAAFFEHQILGPLVFAVAVLLAFAVVKRRESLAAAVTAGLAGFWIVVAGFGLFTGTTDYARLLLVPFAGAFVLFGLAHRIGGRVAVLALTHLAGALLGAAFWVSARAPQASTFPTSAPPKRFSIPESEPTLQTHVVDVSIRENAVIIDAGRRRMVIVPSFEYDAVADGCGFTVLDYRSAKHPPYRAGGHQGRLVFAAENDDFQTSGRVEMQNDATVRIEVSTTVKRELCAHLGSVVSMQLPRGREALINGMPWPSGGADEPAHFVAFQGGELGFYRATRDEKGPFTRLGAIDEPVITAGGFRISVPSWKDQASREPSPTAGWGISQGAIEHVGGWFFWGIASTSIGRGWHTVRTAPGTYETTILVEAL
jgi:hypothetical protein